MADLEEELIGQGAPFHDLGEVRIRLADRFSQPNSGPEPFGIVFVEVLYAGLPVIATAICGAHEIVDASCGRVARSVVASALCDSLAELIWFSGMRQRLGSGGLPAPAMRSPSATLAKQSVLSNLGV
jgi:glycosyltransferase involved in cell wall biosynthesis